MGVKLERASSLRPRVFLIDDHPILREGFAQLLSRQAGFEVCGQAADGSEVAETIRKLKPDLVIVDVELRGSSGIEVIKILSSGFPQMKILALSMHEEGLYAESAIRAGASGYVMKQAPVDELIGAMRRVLRGERYLSARMQERLADSALEEQAQAADGNLERLSEREREVFRLIGSGIRTREIAQQLKLSAKTVETHRAHIVEKLKLRDGAELVHYAIKVASERDGAGDFRG